MTRRSAEIWIVLGLSLGQSAVYAVVSLLAKLTAGPLRDATATLNPSRSDREWLDLGLQVLGIGFALVPVALALYLLGPGAGQRMGIDRTRPLRDLAAGAGLATLVGLPGLGLYALGRHLGVTAEVVLAPEQAYWWTVPVLLLAAVQNAVVEEVIVVGYLLTRLREFAWGSWAAITTSALLRGAYHLYQGFGPALGNVAMGLVFGWLYRRNGRVLPLMIAHTLLDVVAFVGYLWFADDLGIG